MSVACGEQAAFEGDREGVECWLPAIHPSPSTTPGRIEAANHQGEALEGGLAGAEVGEYFGGPAVDGGREPGDLWDVDGGGPVEEPLEGDPGGEDVRRRVHGPEQLFGHVGAADLLVVVPGCEGRIEPGGSVLVEPIGGREQQLADLEPRLHREGPGWETSGSRCTPMPCLSAPTERYENR